MKFLNANTLHNILNVVLVVVGGLTGALLAAGCVQIAGGSLDCSHALIPPADAGYVVTAIGALKIVMNICRDGITGLVAPQPPVQK